MVFAVALNCTSWIFCWIHSDKHPQVPLFLDGLWIWQSESRHFRINTHSYTDAKSALQAAALVLQTYFFSHWMHKFPKNQCPFFVRMSNPLEIGPWLYKWLIGNTAIADFFKKNLSQSYKQIKMGSSGCEYSFFITPYEFTRNFV